MKALLFRNVTIIDDHGPHDGKQMDVLVEDGKISHIEKEISNGAVPDVVEEMEGGCLSIGWTDMRVHLTDPGFEYKEDLESLAVAARRGGFTTVLTLPNTFPVIDNGGLVRSLALRSQSLPLRILPAGALSKGTAGEDLAEVYDMSKAGAVAFTDGLHSVATTGLLLRGLQYLKSFEGLLIDFPMDHSLVQHAAVAEGISATKMGLKGAPTLAETLAVDRNLQVLDYFEGRLHLGPITSAEAIRRIGSAKDKYKGLSAETSALYLLMSEEDTESFDANSKLWPPLRSAEDRKALCEAIRSGAIDVVSSSHHPQSTEEKKHDFTAAQAGASTIELAFAGAWTGYEAFGGQLSELVRCFTSGPRKVLNLEAKHISAGTATDLTWFEGAKTWTPSKEDLHSKSKFSPLLGRALKGRVMGTLCEQNWMRN